VVDLSSLGAQTAGIWTRAEALALLPAGQVRALLRDGDWQTVIPGIYTDGGITPDAEQRAIAAVRASGGSSGQPVHKRDRASWRAIAVGRTAARVWGFPLIDDDDPATDRHEARIDDVGTRTGRRHLVVPAGEGQPGWELRRTRPTLAPVDVSRRASGLVVTSPLRTLFDCASLLSHEALVCALDDALHRNVVTLDGLLAYAEEHRGSAGVPAFRAAVARADGRAESPHETLVRLLLLPVLPALEPQLELYERGQLIARFDLADELARFAVEADGRLGHAGAMVAKDRRRDRRTTRLGWHTERVTWFEVRREASATRTRIVAEHAKRPVRDAVPAA
jgi:hypothetical protein